MLEPLVQEEKSDKRFADGDWEGNPVFNYIKQAYLLNAEYVSQMVESLEFEDGKMGEQVRFYTRQLVNSMAPSNYVFTNPEVCREILKPKASVWRAVLIILCAIWKTAPVRHLKLPRWI